MSPTHSNKRIASKGRNGQDVESCRVDPFNASNQAACKRYRYYVSQAQIQNRLQDLGSVSKISAGEIENFVTEKLKEYAFSKIHLQELFEKYPVRQQKMIFEQIESKEIDVNFIRHALLKVRISKEMVSIIFSKTLLKEAIEYLIFGTNLPVEQKYDKNSIEELNYNIRISSTTKNGSKIIIGDTCRKEVNKFLIEAIVKSFYYHKLMFEDKLTSEQKANTHIYRLMKLRFLPKNIIQDILTGNHEPDWTIDKLYTFL